MLSQISSRQFEEWRAYADLEPFDEVRADMRSAQVVQTLRNVHRGKGRPVVKLEDCLLKFKRTPTVPTPPAAKPVVSDAERARAQVRQTMGLLMAIHNKPRGKKKAGR